MCDSGLFHVLEAAHCFDFGSLNNNVLCGLSLNPFTSSIEGTYTTEGITALCEGLKQSKMSSLRCVCQICEHA